MTPRNWNLHVLAAACVSVLTLAGEAPAAPRDDRGAHAAPLDHFKCYAVAAAPFAQKAVQLRDQFGSTETLVKGMTRLCNPAKAGSVGIAYAAAHLACHAFGAAKTPPLFDSRTVTVNDRFGTSAWVLVKPVALCVASSKRDRAVGAPSGAPQAVPTTVDHFRCYEVSTRKAAAVQKTLEVQDQFQDVQVKVVKPLWLCTPLRVNGSALNHPASHLACYGITQPAFGSRAVSVRNIFGVSTHVATAPATLCVPAKKTPYPILTVQTAGDGGGLVKSASPGISCFQKLPANEPPDCEEEYKPGTVVTLTAGAGPSQDSTFSGWSGPCSGTGECVVTMGASKTVTATFTALEPELKVTILGPGGTVSIEPAGVTCPPLCAFPLPFGTVATLTAKPKEPGPVSTFVGWGGACTGTGPCVVTMDGPKEVQAFFEPNFFALTVTKSGTGTGTVTSDPGAINCGPTCQIEIGKGATLTLKATPDGGSTFAGWTGACSGTGDCVVTMDGPKTVTATFDLGAAPTFVLTVGVIGEGGRVVSSPGGIDCPGACSAAFPAGTVVDLEALVTQRDVMFVGWSGDCGGAGGCRVQMNGPRSVTATFR